jgi:hypothetical protein
VTGRDDGADTGPEASVVPIETITREATWRRLAELARTADPAPRSVADAASALGALGSPGRSGSERWRSIDDELAVLEYDSDFDDTLLQQVRSVRGSIRQLTFRAPQLTLELEVIGSIPRRLTCQVVPLQPASLEVRLADGRHIEMARSGGTFVVGSLPPGPVSLRCRPLAADGASVATSWFRI